MSNCSIGSKDQRSSQSREGPSSPPGTGRVSRGLIAGLGGLALVIAAESGFLESDRGQIQRPVEAAGQADDKRPDPVSIDSVLSDKRNALQTFKAWGRETAHALNASTKESMVYKLPSEVLAGFKVDAKKSPMVYLSKLISHGKSLERRISEAATPQERALRDQMMKKYPGIAYALAYLAGVPEGPSIGWYLSGIPSRFKYVGMVFYVGHPPKTNKIILALDVLYKSAGKAVAKAPDAVAVFDNGPAERYFTSVVIAAITEGISSRHRSNSYTR